jgi:hypothetical protein
VAGVAAFEPIGAVWEAPLSDWNATPPRSTITAAAEAASHSLGFDQPCVALASGTPAGAALMGISRARRFGGDLRRLRVKVFRLYA